MFSYMTTLYLSSLSAPLATQDSPRDLWGNAKVPSPKSLNGSIYESHNSWLDVLETPAARYMNLIGIPIGNLSDLSTDVSSHMTIESLQLDVHCTASMVTTTNKFVAEMEPMYTNFRSAPTNGSFQSYGLYSDRGIPTSLMYVSNSSFQDYLQDPSLPIIIYYGSTTNENPNGTTASGRGISLITCSMTPLSLESNVSCGGDSCAINAVRRLPTSMDQDQKAMLSIALTNGAFCGMGLAYHTVQSSQTELFLANPASVIGGKDQYTWVSLWTLPLDVLEDRLMLAFNAFYYVMGAQLFSGGINGLEPSNNAWHTNTSVSMTERLGERYVCNKAWLALALIITIILEIMAVTSAILRSLTPTPDIFGYVSSLTIDNEYCNEHNLAKSTALNGLERSRAMGRTKFGLMDVRGQEEVGHIAFVPLLNDANTGGHSSAQVRANRFYD